MSRDAEAWLRLLNVDSVMGSLHLVWSDDSRDGTRRDNYLGGSNA